MLGEVVKLDRGFPLVSVEGGGLIRCEHATSLVKGADTRAVIGDIVEVHVPQGHDVGVIEGIRPRRTQFVRKDPTERALPQVLAANFDRVVVVQPVSQVNLRRLERELVLAFETGAEVTVLLTKADLVADTQQTQEALRQVKALAGANVSVLLMSADDATSIDAIRDLMQAGTTTVLIGRSGVGKSTLVNILSGKDVRRTSAVRAVDGKGRHTTVSREIVQLPGRGRIVDMPGVRGLGLWEADEGIDAAFADIEQLAENCRFRDCKHGKEPGCAVRAAVEAGDISEARFSSYKALRDETAAIKEKREQARWREHEKAPDKKPMHRRNSTRR